jgi:hypothetical protein
MGNLIWNAFVRDDDSPAAQDRQMGWDYAQSMSLCL